jgi:hypothetical protein
MRKTKYVVQCRIKKKCVCVAHVHMHPHVGGERGKFRKKLVIQFGKIKMYVGWCIGLFSEHRQDIYNIYRLPLLEHCLHIFRQWACTVLCDDCVGGGDNEEEDDEGKEHEPEPVLSYAEALTAFQTVKSFF